MTDSKKKKWQANSLGLVSMVSIPLQGKEEKVIGVLNCFTKQPYEFSETDINMLSAIATQAAIVIHNTELIKKTKIIEQELQIRKRIEEGKKILMDRRRMNVEEAYRWIQKRSMDTRKSMLEIAEALMLSEDL